MTAAPTCEMLGDVSSAFTCETYTFGHHMHHNISPAKTMPTDRVELHNKVISLADAVNFFMSACYR